ncbi:MAG: aminopeptidase [Clostridia bacterium]
MTDPRQRKLANILINYSCSLQKGEKILIEAFGVDHEFVTALVEEAYAAGGLPFVQINDNRIRRTLLRGISRELAETMCKYDAFRMSEMNAYIGVRGGNNCYELRDVDGELMQIYDKYYSHPVHHELRVKKTKWVVLRYPTEGMAELAKMSTAAFEDFYFDVCTLDYRKMDKAMDSLAELINRTDKVRITAKDTDLTFSIKGIGSEKCSGLRNIPDGEIYTAPIRDSVNGVISYNVPSIEKGIEFKDVRLEFKNGKIIKATANYTEAANKIFDTDEGARYVGEFAIGVNPFINNPMGDILFDEKIAGSIHFTPGACYDECYNGNISAIHWDLVLIQTPEYGGGEIYFDDVLIRKDGRFVLPQLLCLNPENLV